MAKSVDHYEQIIRRTTGSSFEKVRAVLHEYANPVGRMNPAFCVYQKSRSFARDVNEALVAADSTTLNALVARLNHIFNTTAKKHAIKVEGDFRNALRAITRVIRSVRLDFINEGELMILAEPEVEIARTGDAGAGSSCERTNTASNPKFLDLHKRLFTILTAPRVDESLIADIRSQCRSESDFTYIDLIAHHDTATGETAIHACIQAFSIDQHAVALKLIGDFIALGLDVDSRDKFGRTPLLKAAMLGHENVCEELRYKHGADEYLHSDEILDAAECPTNFMRFVEGKAHALDLETMSRTGSACSKETEVPTFLSAPPQLGATYALDVFASAHRRQFSTPVPLPPSADL